MLVQHANPPVPFLYRPFTTMAHPHRWCPYLAWWDLLSRLWAGCLIDISSTSSCCCSCCSGTNYTFVILISTLVQWGRPVRPHVVGPFHRGHIGLVLDELRLVWKVDRSRWRQQQQQGVNDKKTMMMMNYHNWRCKFIFHNFKNFSLSIHLRDVNQVDAKILKT